MRRGICKLFLLRVAAAEAGRPHFYTYLRHVCVERGAESGEGRTGACTHTHTNSLVISMVCWCWISNKNIFQ